DLSPRLLVEGEEGKLLALHNDEDPEKIAETTGSKISQQHGVMVLLGMGLGYLAKVLAKKVNDELALLVYEADPGIFKTALHQIDLTGLLGSSMIKIVVGKHADLGSQCYYYMLKTRGTVQVVRYEPAFRLSPQLYEQKWKNEILHYTNTNLINHVTAHRLGPLFVQGVLEQIPHVVTSLGVNRLEGLFTGKPAILIAAGPSLRKNVHLLREAKGKAILISADTVLGYLLARGISPDFVVSVDPQEETYSKYMDVDIPKDVSLVYHPSCNAQIVQHFPGLKFVCNSSMPTYEWLKHCWPDKGSLDGHVQCQVHLGFNLARALGCDPIIIIGHDLCYTDDLMHVKGGSYLKEEDETNLVKKGVKTSNMFGEIVGTYPVFLGYKATIERSIEAFSGRVINATEGGVNLEGAENLLLMDAISPWCEEKTFQVSSIMENLVEVEGDKPDWDILLGEVKGRIRDYFRLKRVSRHLLKLMDDIDECLKMYAGNDPKLDKLTDQAERLTGRVSHYSKALGLLQLIDFSLEEYMWKASTDAVDLIDDPIERLRKQLDRGRRYYTGILNAAPVIEGFLKELHSRLERQWQLEGCGLQKSPDMEGLNQIKAYVDIGLFDKAEMITAPLVEKVAHPHVDPQLAKISVQVSLELHQISIARRRVKAFGKCCVKDPEWDNLLNKVETSSEKWEKRIQEVEVREVATPPPLNSGDFYYRLKNYSRARNHYERIACDSELLPAIRGEAWFRSSKTYVTLEEKGSKVFALEQALALAPADPKIYYDLGVVSLEMQGVATAEKFFQKGVEVSLDDPEFCEAVGAVLCAAGAHAQAIPYFEQALLTCPTDSRLLQEISQAYQYVFAVEPTA
ncbi:MAG: 6-hydroxymethylpterin diphosphokinase MptE-like protein, partial [Nitrospirota bacterium]|nr:6-hydroxymethylpterin diphosphokinase MptE-like protein [Nitrospirota bacterium]